MFKAKYYLQCNFLEARLGNLPSYTWKSIWVTKGLLKKGLCWRVGKGDKFFVVKAVWIRRAKNYRINGSVSDNGITRVSEWINSLTKTWKVGVVKDTFFEVDASRILRIPLATMEHEDMVVWRGESFGEFSVRSGYKLFLNSTFDPNTTDLHNNMKHFYRKLWNLKTKNYSMESFMEFSAYSNKSTL